MTSLRYHLKEGEFQILWFYTMALRFHSNENNYFYVQFSSVAQSCPTLCDPMYCSMPGLPGHNQLPEFTQTHVHWIGDGIQTSHLLSSPSPPAFNISQHQGLFQWVNHESTWFNPKALSSPHLVDLSAALDATDYSFFLDDFDSFMDTTLTWWSF